MGKKDWNLAYAYLKGVDPSSDVNFNKLDKKLQNKVKKILGTRKRGNNGENFGSNRGNFTLAGISKLKNTSPDKSKQYEKAKKIAEEEAKKIADELEKEFAAGIKQKSKNQKIKDRKKINRKRERIELVRLNEQEQEKASAFIQAVMSDEYSKEELMKNFCRLKNEGIRDNIVVNAFIPKFMKNIQEINIRLKNADNLDVLGKNYYEFEARYRQIFKVFYELQLKFYDILHIQIDLIDLLKLFGMDFSELDEFIKYINENGFNFDTVQKLEKWINIFKTRASEKFEDLNIESLQQQFVLETQSDIEPILRNFFLRKLLIGIKEETTADNFTKTIGAISRFHHVNSVPSYIIQIINVLKGEGNIQTFYEKYDKGYFTPEEKAEVESLVTKLGVELESLKIKYDEDIKVQVTKKKEEEYSLLENELAKLINQLYNELESFKSSINNSNQNKNKKIKDKEEENKKLINEKEEEINKEKEEVEKKYKEIKDKLNEDYNNSIDKLLKDLEEKLTVIHTQATQRFSEDTIILRRYFELKKKLEKNLKVINDEEAEAGVKRVEVDGVDGVDGVEFEGGAKLKGNWKLEPKALKKKRKQAEIAKQKIKNNAITKLIKEQKSTEQNRLNMFLKNTGNKPVISISSSKPKINKVNKKGTTNLTIKWNKSDPLAKKIAEQEAKRIAILEEEQRKKQDELNKKAKLLKSKLNNPWRSNRPLARKLAIQEEIRQLKEKREAEKKEAEKKEAELKKAELKKAELKREAELKKVELKKENGINKTLKKTILNLLRYKKNKSTDLVKRKRKNYKRIFVDNYTKFFYPLEYLLAEYKKIITSYNELFTDVLQIKDKLYFYMKIYNRLKSKDPSKFSCTLAYISFQILNIDEIIESLEDDNSIQENFIKVFRDYCGETVFPNDISANASVAALKQSIPQLEGNQVKRLLIGTSSDITKKNESSALTIFSKEAAKARANNQVKLTSAQKKREENEEKRKLEKISNLFGRIKNKTSNNRELTLEELREIKAIQEGLKKELEGNNTQHEIQNYLTQLNINKRISNEQRRLRELEIVEILHAANNLPNDTPITDVKKTLDKLIKIKESNSDILTESNNQIIDNLIERFKSVFNQSSTFENKLQNFQANKEKYKKSIKLEELKELLDKVKKLLVIQGISEDNKKQLKLEKRLIRERIDLLEKPNLRKFTSLNEPNEKAKKEKKFRIRGEEKAWYSKIDNILFISKENTNKIRKEKMIEKRVDEEKIKEYKSKFLKLIINFYNKDEFIDEVYINDIVKDFIDKIALPLWNKLNKKQLEFKKNKNPPQQEIYRLKIELQNIFMDCIDDKEKITISNLFYRFLYRINRFSKYAGVLNLTFNRKSNNTDEQNLDFVISLAK
jgi:hypothetical protein